MYEALLFLLIWYSVSTTLFQMIRSKVFISDCGRFFDTIATFIQTIAGCIVLTGKNVAQISDGISNPVVAGIGYWLIRILVCGGCLVGAGILLAFIGIKIAGLYKKCCWDILSIITGIKSTWLQKVLYFWQNATDFSSIIINLIKQPVCNEAYRLLAFYNSNESSASTHICKLPSRYNLAYSSGASSASEVNAQHIANICINVNAVSLWIVFCKYCSHRIPSSYHLINH